MANTDIFTKLWNLLKCDSRIIYHHTLYLEIFCEFYLSAC